MRERDPPFHVLLLGDKVSLDVGRQAQYARRGRIILALGFAVSVIVTVRQGDRSPSGRWAKVSVALLLQASLLFGACVQPVWHKLWAEADGSTAATRSRTFRKLHMPTRRVY